MKKFNKLNKLEDWAFEHNRNEEAPGFDDFKWWEDMEAEKLRRERFKLDCSPNLPKCTICSRAFQAYIIEKARELNRSFSFKDYPEINHDLFRKLILMLKKSGRVLPMKLRTNPRFFILTEWKDRYPTMTENNRVKPKFPSDEESLEETQGGS
jgi:hypothetical protein